MASGKLLGESIDLAQRDVSRTFVGICREHGLGGGFRLAVLPEGDQQRRELELSVRFRPDPKQLRRPFPGRPTRDSERPIGTAELIMSFCKFRVHLDRPAEFNYRLLVPPGFEILLSALQILDFLPVRIRGAAAEQDCSDAECRRCMVSLAADVCVLVTILLTLGTPWAIRSPVQGDPEVFSHEHPVSPREAVPPRQPQPSPALGIPRTRLSGKNIGKTP